MMGGYVHEQSLWDTAKECNLMIETFDVGFYFCGNDLMTTTTTTCRFFN